jgi:hypothetical protein
MELKVEGPKKPLRDIITELCLFRNQVKDDQEQRDILTAIIQELIDVDIKYYVMAKVAEPQIVVQQESRDDIPPGDES